jgi:hypothetical protein
LLTFQEVKMSQELSIAGIVAVLKQVVQQPTDALTAQVGTDAVQAAHALMHRVETELEPTTVKRFRERPERTQQLEDDIADVAAQNPTFAADLRELYAKYEAAAKSKPASGGTTLTMTGSPGGQQVTGSGNVVTSGDTLVENESVHVGSIDAKGPVNVGSGTQHMGDVTGRDKITIGGSVGPGSVVGSGSVKAKNIAGGNIYDGVSGGELAQIFATLQTRVDAIADPGDREMANLALKQVQHEAEQIEAGDESEERQNALLKRLKNLRQMASDIGDVAITTLANPALGIAMVIKKIAGKAQKEVEADG